jgi:hypothetical protein
MSDQRKDQFDHLTDYIDEQEKTKETLKNGLLRFLKYVKEVEDERLHRSE